MAAGARPRRGRLPPRTRAVQASVRGGARPERRPGPHAQPGALWWRCGGGGRDGRSALTLRPEPYANPRPNPRPIPRLVTCHNPNPNLPLTLNRCSPCEIAAPSLFRVHVCCILAKVSAASVPLLDPTTAAPTPSTRRVLATAHSSCPLVDAKPTVVGIRNVSLRGRSLRGRHGRSAGQE